VGLSLSVQRPERGTHRERRLPRASALSCSTGPLLCHWSPFRDARTFVHGARRIRDAQRVSRRTACITHTVGCAAMSAFADACAPCFSPNEANAIELVAAERRFMVSSFRDCRALVHEIPSNSRYGTKIGLAPPRETLGVIQAWGARGLVFAGG
jgi:hypothetical protein